VLLSLAVVFFERIMTGEENDDDCPCRKVIRRWCERETKMEGGREERVRKRGK